MEQHSAPVVFGIEQKKAFSKVEKLLPILGQSFLERKRISKNDSLCTQRGKGFILFHC